jgi:hypothetical protein
MKNAHSGPALLSAGIEARAWNGCAIQRRQSDGFVNATAMCRAGGKRWTLYSANDRTRQYICALAGSLGLQIPCAAAEVGFPTSGIPGLIQVIKGGRPDLQGTWIHPRLAVDLARWISPSFAVWMDGWFLEALGVLSPLPTPAPVVRSKPAPTAARSMSDQQLQSTSSLLPSLLCQRRQGDFMANDLIRSFASHLLLSCDQALMGDELADSMVDWHLALRRRTGPAWEQAMITTGQTVHQAKRRQRARLAAGS